ncbi:MAG: 2-hydroxyacyl-CoA dehydratase, partial [Clostridia bacterium]|nr:2-hydroxyacyl-CoA dehydratase [Clostridia bacterium]
MDNYGKLYKEHTAILKHREWRGFKDTMYDYYRWLVTWKDMIKMVLKAPVSTVKGIWRYRWMSSYLSAPSFIDRHVAGLRGPQLRMAHLHYNMIVKHTTHLINISLRADEKINPGNKLSKRIVLMDEIVPNEVFTGFPNLIPMPLQTLPIFLSSMVDQQITPPYLEVTESFGVPADVCPLPSAEAGVAIEDDYPKMGCCMVGTNMPCDGSIMNSSFLDRRLGLPTHCFGVPLRYDGEDVQEYAVEEIKSLIKFIEDQTGEKFDWDAYFRRMKDYNKQLEYERQKW